MTRSHYVRRPRCAKYVAGSRCQQAADVKPVLEDDWETAPLCFKHAAELTKGGGSWQLLPLTWDEDWEMGDEL